MSQAHSLCERGFARFRGAFDPEKLATLVQQYDEGRAGIRIPGDDGLSQWLRGSEDIGAIFFALKRPAARPVRAILFDKSPEANWALGWHQDRTICVKERVEVAGYGPWTVKSGLIHVEPPFPIIERMLTLRFHIDAVSDDNAPLLVAEGSHRLGLLTGDRIESEAARCATIACHAGAGDVWAYSTPILHASDRSRSLNRRRVLQVDFSDDKLSGGLEWFGV